MNLVWELNELTVSNESCMRMNFLNYAIPSIAMSTNNSVTDDTLTEPTLSQLG